MVESKDTYNLRGSTTFQKAGKIGISFANPRDPSEVLTLKFEDHKQRHDWYHLIQEAISSDVTHSKVVQLYLRTSVHTSKPVSRNTDL